GDRCRMNPAARKRGQTRHGPAHGKISDISVGIQTTVLDHHPGDFTGAAADLRYSYDFPFQILKTFGFLRYSEDIRQDVFLRGNQDDVRPSGNSRKRRYGIAGHELRMTGKQTLNREPAPFHINKL